MSILDNLEELSNERSKLKRSWMRQFQNFCIFLTIYITCWCFHKYMQDKDVSHVNYRRFHDDINSLYPSLTLCFNNPFLEDRLKETGEGVNITTYVHFLEGNLWDKRMVNIDYDNVTVDLKDYLEFSEIDLRNTSKFRDNKYYVSMRSPRMKCFSFDVPFVRDTGVEFFIVKIKNSIFPFGFRPAHHDFYPSRGRFSGGFEVRLSYPHQVFRSDFANKWRWNELDKNGSIEKMKKMWVGMSFDVKHIETLKRRSKSSLPCNEDWQNDDQQILGKLFEAAKCKPPFLSKMSDMSLCTWVCDCRSIPSNNDI